MRASALAAAFLGDEQTGDLTLRPRRHHDRARLRLLELANRRLVTEWTYEIFVT